MEKNNAGIAFFISFGLTAQHVEGSNLYPLQWKHSLNHWTTREVLGIAVLIRVINEGFSEKQRRERCEDSSLWLSEEEHSGQTEQQVQRP